MDVEVNPVFQSKMPYTVQYNESDYKFLKRLAKRYGEYFYYEDGKIIFGKMKEYEPITMRTGIDMEKYEYDLNMNHHLGIDLFHFDYMDCYRLYTAEKGVNASSQLHGKYPVSEMGKPVHERSAEYFNSDTNSVSNFESARIVDDAYSASMFDEHKNGALDEADYDRLTSLINQRSILEEYVISDSSICSGKARRADLKLGSVIVIEDETSTADGTTDYIQHEPLKVIDLFYKWEIEKSRSLENKFKAIPQVVTRPPYLQRDENGFLVYGDFDNYPKCGPLPGRVLDNKDPFGVGRVKVLLQWQAEVERSNLENSDSSSPQENFTPWIRVAQPLGGLQIGSYIVPEIGDEVIVGFESNNAECPYVMCSMHNYGYDRPDENWTAESRLEQNEIKAIRTRNGHTIEIHDDGNGGSIKIYDENTHNYVVEYDTDKKLIKLESKGNIELSAHDNIVLHAGKKIVMDAGTDMEVNVKNDMTTKVEHDQVLEVTNDRIIDVYHEEMHNVSNYYHVMVTNTDEKFAGSVLTLRPELAVMRYCPDGEDQQSYMYLNSENASLGSNYSGAKVSLLSKQGAVEIESATNDVTVKAAQKIAMEATTSLEMKGMTTKLEAEVTNELKGKPLKLN